MAQEIYPEAIAVPETKLRRGKPLIATLPPEWEGCHLKYRENTYNFIAEKIVKVMADQRLAHAMPGAETQEEANEYEDLLVPRDGRCSM